jgi:hypothetical protein
MVEFVWKKKREMTLGKKNPAGKVISSIVLRNGRMGATLNYANMKEMRKNIMPKIIMFTSFARIHECILRCK